MKQTILIVDDLALNIDALTNCLSDDYKIMAAVSGENAIRLLEHKKPDLVLLDVSMPGIDGFGVLKFMKQQKDLSNIPVIFVTGEYDKNVEEKGLQLGAVDYVKKPVSAEILRVKVRNHLELKAYRDNLELLVSERTHQLEIRKRQLERLTEQLSASHEAIIMAMSLMSESHDSITGEHIMRIKTLTKILADKISELYPEFLSKDLARLTVMYSPLHDVGKISISDTILKKSGILSKEEFEIMKNHTLEGGKLLRKTKSFLSNSNNEDLQTAIEIAESHHEKFDGSGYPYGLKNKEIPLSARIVALTDIYDALRSQRSYKEAMSHEEAFEVISSGNERTNPEHFDPKILQTFRIIHKEFEKVKR